ncbi:unnamed protein product, partial [Pylaiella littoralis]
YRFEPIVIYLYVALIFNGCTLLGPGHRWPIGRPYVPFGPSAGPNNNVDPCFQFTDHPGKNNACLSVFLQYAWRYVYKFLLILTVAHNPRSIARGHHKPDTYRRPRSNIGVSV